MAQPPEIKTRNLTIFDDCAAADKQMLHVGLSSRQHGPRKWIMQAEIARVQQVENDAASLAASRVRHGYWCTTVLRNTPIFSTTSSTTSPLSR